MSLDDRLACHTRMKRKRDVAFGQVYDHGEIGHLCRLVQYRAHFVTARILGDLRRHLKAAIRHVFNTGAKDIHLLSDIYMLNFLSCANDNELDTYTLICETLFEEFMGIPHPTYAIDPAMQNLSWTYTAPAVQQGIFTLFLCNLRGFGVNLQLPRHVMTYLVRGFIFPALAADRHAHLAERYETVCRACCYLERFWIPNQRVFDRQVTIRLAPAVDETWQLDIDSLPTMFLSIKTIADAVLQIVSAKRAVIPSE